MQPSQLPGNRADGGHVFVALDGLRGAAAIAVAIFHYSIHLGHPLLPNAYLAVDFFFALSGFVIAHAYERKLQAGEGFGRFMRRRLVRLYPLYWLSITLAMATVLLETAWGLPHANRFRALASYALSLVFLPTPSAITPYDGSAFPLNDPAWSLSLEIGVNAIYAAICRRLTDRHLIVLLAVSALALCAVAFRYHGLQLGNTWPSYLAGWARVSWSFFAGILLYRLYDRRRGGTLPSWVGVLLVLAVGILFAAPDAGPVLNLADALVFFPLIIWLGAQVRLAGAAARVASWLGLTSYALYIIHLPLLILALDLAGVIRIDPTGSFAPFLAMAVGAALLAAWLLDRLYDTPVRQWLSRRRSGPADPVISNAAADPVAMKE